LPALPERSWRNDSGTDENADKGAPDAASALPGIHQATDTLKERIDPLQELSAALQSTRELREFSVAQAA
jgi:hypothetical protein